nr:MAG TPA: hypothetical protein [Caudoviricetes sp.]
MRRYLSYTLPSLSNFTYFFNLMMNSKPAAIISQISGGSATRRI